LHLDESSKVEDKKKEYGYPHAVLLRLISTDYFIMKEIKKEI